MSEENEKIQGTENRREWLRKCALLAAIPALDYDALAAVQNAARRDAAHSISIAPRPLFDVSPYLYMQFMEPLGTTDGSVEAAWDYDIDDWRRDFVSVTADLAPGVIRWGGLLSRYYKWREAVGPVKERVPMYNYLWGGVETNRIGTAEFIKLCQRVKAEPLFCVNFLSDGDKQFLKTSRGEARSGDAREAADWVSYCNDPDERSRRAHGQTSPYGVKLWQIGNETSYGKATFTKDDSIAHTIEFAKAMKARDKAIALIGWGDKNHAEPDGTYWAGDLIERAGEHLSYVAMHMMNQVPKRRPTVLRGHEYQKQPEVAWSELQELADDVERRITEFESRVGEKSSDVGIAVTEGHLSLSPHNACPILQEWLSGVFHARSLNSYLRHGARVKIATAADFQGTRWTVTAAMIPVPRGTSYLMPVGAVMRLYKKHCGRQGVTATSTTSDLDVAASRSGNKFFLHVANRRYNGAVEAAIAVRGGAITGGKVYEIAPTDLETYVNQDQRDVFTPQEKSFGEGPVFKWTFPAASVSAVELDMAR